MKKYVIVLVALIAVLMFCIGYIVNSLISVSTLERMAEEEGVSVTYASTETMQQKQVEYSFDDTPAGLYYSKTTRIFIDSDMYLDYWVLAHELGHHYSIKLWGDHSERAADLFGAQILRDLNNLPGGGIFSPAERSMA